MIRVLFALTLACSVYAQLLRSSGSVLEEMSPSGAGVKGEALNEWPTIGIFAQPAYDDAGNCGGSCQYIASSYVKQIEAAGARVVPIDYYSTTAELDALFGSINGLLFPGGGAPFPSGAQYMFDKVVAANDAGDYFPLWGTCMGFQWLLICGARDQTILDPNDGSQMDAYNISLNLEFTPAAPTSKMFKDVSPELVDVFAHQNVTMNNHHYGMWTEHFQQVDSLTEFYDLLSTNEDRNGDSFISTIEAKKYPIFGSQWHPEKNLYEWSKDADGTPTEAIDHSQDGMKAASLPGAFLVAQARRNTHTFPDVQTETAALIYNYSPTFVGYPGGPSSFEQKYYFNWGTDAQRAERAQQRVVRGVGAGRQLEREGEPK